RGKWGFVSGSKKDPPENDSSYERWMQENYTVIEWLVNSMQPQISQHYLWMNLAKEIWGSVAETYSQKLNVAKAYKLMSDVKNLRQGEKSLVAYFSTLKSLWQEIDLIEAVTWDNPNDAETYRKLVEKNRVFEFLTGLNPEYDITKQNILSKESVSLSQAYALVSSEESRRQVQVQGVGINDHFANMGVKPKGVIGTPSGTRKKEMVCEYCKKPKHTKDKCWKLHPSLVPVRFQKKNDSRKTGSANAAMGTDTEVESACA
ncbi:PREDICTED: uncharacterized protein LOC109114308, partial [Nelumbo nucifera]|uniref:Uncharacterized protein LOC109114308 n=1 Tax=Nelumbo nucifera TaxID=4432 RepID=A0A1U8Q2G6_NELNU